jgi:beta-lactamase regulating signal transducer with metallopeptidase domain
MNRNVRFYTCLILFLASLAVTASIASRIKEKYDEDDEVLQNLRLKLQSTFPELDSVVLLRGNKSYTINKRKIYMCLKDENNKYYNENMLVYVLLHELAHVKCTEIGHTDAFHKIFQQLLEQATEKGLYDPSIPIVRDYCDY